MYENTEYKCSIQINLIGKNTKNVDVYLRLPRGLAPPRFRAFFWAAASIANRTKNNVYILKYALKSTLKSIIIIRLRILWNVPIL